MTKITETPGFYLGRKISWWFSPIVLGVIFWLASGFVNLGPTVVSTTAITIKAINFTAGAEGLITVIPTRNYVDGAGVTTVPVTANSTMKLQVMCVGVTNAGAAIQSTLVKLRVNPTGAALINSPVVAMLGVSTWVATAGVSNGNCVQLGDGVEISGLNQLSVTQTGSALAGFDLTIFGYERAL